MTARSPASLFRRRATAPLLAYCTSTTVFEQGLPRMGDDGITYSRVVGWLKIGLPLAALSLADVPVDQRPLGG